MPAPAEDLGVALPAVALQGGSDHRSRAVLLAYSRRARRASHNPASPIQQPDGAGTEFVSLKTLAKRWDCSRTTVTRLLDKAGVQAFFLGQGRNGTKRYRKEDIEAFLRSIEHC